jgi:hypothetical protein
MEKNTKCTLSIDYMIKGPVGFELFWSFENSLCKWINFCINLYVFTEKNLYIYKFFSS